MCLPPPPKKISPDRHGPLTTCQGVTTSWGQLKKKVQSLSIQPLAARGTSGGGDLVSCSLSSEKKSKEGGRPPSPTTLGVWTPSCPSLRRGPGLLLRAVLDAPDCLGVGGKAPVGRTHRGGIVKYGRAGAGSKLLFFQDVYLSENLQIQPKKKATQKKKLKSRTRPPPPFPHFSPIEILSQSREWALGHGVTKAGPWLTPGGEGTEQAGPMVHPLLPSYAGRVGSQK